MKGLVRSLLVVFCMLACHVNVVVAATKSHKSAGGSSAKRLNATAKPVLRASPTKSSKGAPVPAPKACKKNRGKRSVTKGCNPSEQVLRSPIKDLDLDRAGDIKDTELKARVAPERAYAVDGDTFFFQGKKFRVSGLRLGDGSEMAKQRLQKALDSGQVAVDPVGVDETGVTTANVKANGRNLADLITAP